MKFIALFAAALLVQDEPKPAGTPYYVGHRPMYVNITFESEADLETIVGSTNKASGTIWVDFDKNTGLVDLKVPVKDLKTGIDMRDKHLRSPNWLDADKYPDITFKSTKVEPVKDKKDRFKVTGEFTMHGKSKAVTTIVTWKELPEAATRKASFPAGKWIKFATSFDIKFSDHGVKVPSMAAGKVADTVKVKMTFFAGTAKIRKRR